MGGIGSGKVIRISKWRKKGFTDEYQQFDAFREFSANGRLSVQQGCLPIRLKACRFGGKKNYWICPKCCRSCRFLYFGSIVGGCRICLKLAYRSQNETLADRLLHKKEKIQNKIVWSPFYTEKPKHMHKKTFEDLCQQAELYYNLANQAFTISARRMSDLYMLQGV